MIAWPIVMAYLTQRYISGKSKPGWHERWGNLPASLHATNGSQPRVWVHAVSAGEVVAAVPILRELRKLLPEHQLMLSVITPAGHEMAELQAAPCIDALFYFPIDLPWVARRVVETIQPQVFVSLESEMWPNLLHELKRAGAHTVMVNGRISESSFRRSRKIAKGLFHWMISNMDKLLMQSEMDAQRIRELGQISDPERVQVMGNSKFDQKIECLTPEQTLALRRRLNLPEEAPVFVAGSTRSLEEEKEVINAYLTMRAEVPDLCLIVAPRHIERADEVAQAMLEARLTPVRYSEITSTTSTSTFVTTLILDTMGQLADIYAVASFAFVGNSFSPVVKGGGQNLLQPLAHGKPVLFGPYTATTRSEVVLAIDARVGFQVANGKELAETGLTLLKNPILREEISARATKLIAANKGVSRRYAEAVANIAHEKTPR